MIETYQTTVPRHNDPRWKLFKEAIQAEMKGLFAHNTFVVVKNSDFTDKKIENMAILKASLVLSLKDADTSDKKAYVFIRAIGNIDKDTKFFLT